MRGGGFCILATVDSLVSLITKRKGALMNKTFRLTFCFLIITCFAPFTMASGVSDRVDLTEFAKHPEAFAGRVIEVRAPVIAINADGKSLELFDSQSRLQIAVRLTQLRKSERLALMSSDVRTIVVSGRASVVAGRLTIDAQNIQLMSLNDEAKVRSKDVPGEAQQAGVIPIAIPN